MFNLSPAPQTPLIRPAILPDEIAHSYAKRLLIANNATSLRELSSKILEFAHLPKPPPKVRILAWAAGMDLDMFVRLHTMTPFQRAFAKANRSHAHGVNLNNHLRHEVLKIKVAEFRCCSACLLEDTDFWGFTYLRVSHHIKGVNWCSKHNTPLTSIGISTSTPDLLTKVTSYPAISATAPPAEERDVLLSRYAEIATDLMARTTPIPIKIISDLLRCEAARLGLRFAKTGRRDLLSDIALRRAPNEWLPEVLKSLSNKGKPDGSYHYALDTVTKSNVTCTPEAYVLGLALVFSSSEKAITALANAESTMSHSTTSLLNCEEPHKTIQALPPITRDALVEAYGPTGFKIVQVAKKLGRSTKRIYDLLRVHRLPPPNLIHPLANQRALLEFLEGGSHSDVCRANDVSPSNFDALLRTDFHQILRFIRDAKTVPDRGMG